MCAPLLSKYELHPADRLIHHRGKRGKRGCRGRVEGYRKDQEKCPKDRKTEGGRGEVGGIGSRWRENERKESVLGEVSGRKG